MAPVHKVVATINTGTQPTNGVAIGAIAVVGSYAYVANFDTKVGTVAIVDTRTDRVVGRIPVGANPLSLVANSSGTRIYVGNWRDNSVSVINTLTNRVVSTITGIGNLDPQIRQGPYALALNPSGSRLYTANNYSNNVSVINTGSNSIVDTVAVQNNPLALAVSPLGKFLYVADSIGPYNQNGNVSIINTTSDKVVANVSVGPTPYGVAFNATGSRAYVSNWGNGTISVINTSTQKVITTIPLGNDKGPQAMALSPNGQNMYVVDELSGEVSVFSTATNRVQTTFSLGGGNPAYLAFASSSQLYVSNMMLGLQDVRIITNSVSTPPAPVITVPASVPVPAVINPNNIPVNFIALGINLNQGFNNINSIIPTITSVIGSDVHNRDRHHTGKIASLVARPGDNDDHHSLQESGTAGDFIIDSGKDAEDSDDDRDH